MLLYVHVPFCVRKCGYCAFHSGPFSAPEAERYVELVLRELDCRGKALGRRAVETVYIGGGTPSLLTPAQIGAILEGAASRFDLEAGAEITLEANPESALKTGFLAAVRALGVNRLSLGVQSLRDDLLATLGRSHDAARARLAAREARESGFANLSLDMIWGLPGQDVSAWLADLAGIVALAPEHISCYGLSLEEGAPLAESVDAGRLSLPDEEEGARMYLEGSAYLESEGFGHYEISNYARPGRESRHNRGYWSGRDYLGLGPAAVSTLDGRRWANPAGLDEYARTAAIGAEREGTEILTADVRRQEMVMLALRTRDGLDLQEFMAATGIEFPRRDPAVERLRSSGLVRLGAGRLQLTREGMLVSNSVIELVLGVLDRTPASTAQESYD
ncbi:radical SAM family heme chaperone HemW [Desulfomicrobium salsuginis]